MTVAVAFRGGICSSPFELSVRWLLISVGACIAVPLTAGLR